MAAAMVWLAFWVGVGVLLRRRRRRARAVAPPLEERRESLDNTAIARALRRRP